MKFPHGVAFSSLFILGHQGHPLECWIFTMRHIAVERMQMLGEEGVGPHRDVRKKETRISQHREYSLTAQLHAFNYPDSTKNDTPTASIHALLTCSSMCLANWPRILLDPNCWNLRQLLWWTYAQATGYRPVQLCPILPANEDCENKPSWSSNMLRIE